MGRTIGLPAIKPDSIHINLILYYMKFLVLVITIIFSVTITGQSRLSPGFDPSEYASLLSLAFNGSGIPDSVERKASHDPYHLEYRSPEAGLMNRWSLYLRDDNVAVINLRGTVNKT